MGVSESTPRLVTTADTVDVFRGLIGGGWGWCWGSGQLLSCLTMKRFQGSGDLPSGFGGVPAAAITTAHPSSARTPLSHDFALALPFPLPPSHALPPAL